jgi:hypothetical protein
MSPVRSVCILHTGGEKGTEFESHCGFLWGAPGWTR